jgi:heat shock protein HslJ
MLAVGLVVGILGVGCGSSSSPSPSTPPASPGGSSAGLDGTWTLTGMTGPSGSAVPLPSTVSPSITFAGTAVSGNSGCNSFNGTATISGSSVTFGAMAATQKACDPATNLFETAFLTGLGTATQFTVTGNTLVLSAAGGQPTLTFTKST